ncbi:hypothetical protein F5Y17DRAFT_468704 [Xylariaceae sp. FL0594]|nr:hypothetical protein F5Y17DRAFT_468704 [Xylariaceae sp. FL0594]
MNGTDSSIPLERRPACDSCKTRKTKCDRKSPCASCVTLNVACRITRQAGEKRQRVLLSSKYEDAVQDVSRQLAEVKGMLQTLMSSNDAPQSLTPPVPTPEGGTAYTPQSMIDEQLPTLERVQEGYHGDTSFTSHAHMIKTTLEATLQPSELEFLPHTPLMTSEEQQGPRIGTVTAANPLIQFPDITNDRVPLPPIDLVLKLLRLLKVEDQRFFVDLPIFERDEFIDMCRDIYFATEPISLWKWISVNVGLLNLFLGLREDSRQRLGITLEAVRAHADVLKSNSEAAMQSLRMCSEPSIDSCQALAVLANFYVRLGHSTIAWRLISAAARGALDLGLHRLPSDPTSRNPVPKEIALFWHIYTWEKGLAMTCGRPPTIRHSDVTSGLHLFSTPQDRRGQQHTLYGAFVDMAVVMGEIQECLFSVAAQQSSQQTRIQHAKRLASRLNTILSSVQSVSPDDLTWDLVYSTDDGAIITILHIVLHSQLAIVYRFLPAGASHVHPLQCAPECVSEARTTLALLLNVGEDGVNTMPAGWVILLNTILSLVPLVPFIVLAGNAIATTSGDDLPLLSRIVSILAPVTQNSQLVRKVHGACESLTKIAERVISRASQALADTQPQIYQPLQGQSGVPDTAGGLQLEYAFSMGQQDWDSAMTGFESEFGEYDSRTLSNIIEPCFANTYW